MFLEIKSMAVLKQLLRANQMATLEDIGTTVPIPARQMTASYLELFVVKNLITSQQPHTNMQTF
jgi:hypothetical protein